MIGTLLVHAMVLQTALHGGQQHRVQPPDTEGPGATLVKSTTEPAGALILVELSTADMASKPMLEGLASAGAAPRNLALTILSADPLPHVEIPPGSDDNPVESPQPPDNGDPAARALLFGRYTGQIQARVERAWRRPRSPVNDGVPLEAEAHSGSAKNNVVANNGFRCEVRILQDAIGTVREVQMLDCNGSVSWQHSLVVAIFAASPLPSPPSPAVFTPSLTMRFEGQSYSPTASPDDYEVEQAAVNPFVTNTRRVPTSDPLPVFYISE